MTVSYNSLWHRDGRICHILRREYVQAEEDMNEKCIMQGEAWYLKWKRVEKWCWFVKKKLFREKECMCWDEGGRDRRREYLNKNAWRGLAAIGVAVVLTMGECVSGIQLGIGKLGGSGMLTSYAEELWIPVSVTAETAQAVENAAELPVQAPEAILMETSTGTILYEKNADEARNPASVTKIMTLLLIFDALHSGKIHLQDEVTTSAHAKSMGGSQVFLEEGEVQTVETLIKCIAVASGNDAAVAMAEYVCGSEEAFVTKMNEKAQSLGMTNTHFTDCCGLTDDDSHHTTARDVAIMSRELVQKYPDIYQYTGIWMEDITHTTARGSTPFTLSSTNKLLKQYQWATGLKTGSTAKAKYCLSATARKDGIDLIAVVMTAPDSRARFLDAAALLSYGYSVSSLYRDDNKDQLLPVPVKGGQEETVPVVYASEFVWLDTDGNDISMVQKRISVPKEAEAPVVVGTKAGEAIYRLNGEQIGTVPILYASNVEKAFYRDYVKKAVTAFLL